MRALYKCPDCHEMVEQGHRAKFHPPKEFLPHLSVRTEND